MTKIASGKNEIFERYEAGLLSRRDALKQLGALGIGVAVASTLLAGCELIKRNVLLLVADDMRYDQLPFMPNVKRLIADQGLSFTQARCNVPLCQPSRVGLLTGQTSRYNGEIQVGFTGTTLTDNDNCLGNWMHGAGYRCGFFGKYVNFIDGLGGIDSPAGYETWRELSGETNNMQFRVRKDNTGYETITGKYQTDYLAEEALAFLNGGTNPAKPFLCIVTPTQPHAPFTPRDDLANLYTGLNVDIVNEVDVSDKPAWIQALAPLTLGDILTLQEDARGSLRELAAVDEMIGKIIDGMDPAVLANTIVIFTSDNGVHRGEHRRLGNGTKSGPYEVGLHVPMIVRGPGFPHVADVTAPVMAFQDIAATVLRAGFAHAGRPHQAGTSLQDIAWKPSKFKDRVLLHEIGQGFQTATGDGITTGPQNASGFRKLYRYPGVRANPNGPFVYEAYDLDNDPNELSNWANNPARRAERNALEAKLLALLSA